MKYILISYYKHTFRTEAGEYDRYLVWGHTSLIENEDIGQYCTESEALQEAFKHGAPVVLGENVSDVLEKLEMKNELHRWLKGWQKSIDTLRSSAPTSSAPDPMEAIVEDCMKRFNL